MNLPSPLQQLQSSLFDDKGVRVFIKRDDLIHPVISGNKWRKLKFNIEKFHDGKYDKLLTFGGAYSNHIAATARTGKELGIDTIGVIRGDELNELSNDTLKQASEDGMELIFTSREEYALRDEKYYHEELRRRHGNILIVPEGGFNFYGVLGCQGIAAEIRDQLKDDTEGPTYILTAAGTGTTAAGLLLGDYNVICISALKGGDFLRDNILALLSQFGIGEKDVQEKLDLKTEFHFGGYAKYDSQLLEFIKNFGSEHRIKLDQVYTGKMVYAMIHLIQNNYFPEGSRVIALHTGGLQGRKAVEHLVGLNS